MNKKLFLIFIFALVLIPSVIALPTPGDVFDIFIDWLSGDLGAGDPNFAGYARLAFGLLIAFIVYEIASHIGVSERLSIIIAGFFAIVGVIAAPKALLVAASTTYNVLIWFILLGVPVFIVSFLVYQVPSEPRAWRVVKILLLLALLLLLAYSLNGFFEAFGNLFSFENNVNFLASWFYTIIFFAILYQLWKLFSPTSLASYLGGKAKSAVGMGPSTVTPTVSAGKIPAMVDPRIKKWKKEMKEYKRAVKKQRAELNGKIDDLSKQVEALQELIMDKKQQPQTPETQKQIKDGEAALNYNRQILVKQLSDLLVNFDDEQRALRKEIETLDREMAELVQKSQALSKRLSIGNVTYEGGEIMKYDLENIRKAYGIKQELRKKKAKQLDLLIKAKIDAARQAEQANRNEPVDTRQIKSDEIAVEAEEEGEEKLEEELDPLAEEMLRMMEEEEKEGATGVQASNREKELEIKREIGKIIQQLKDPNLSVLDRNYLNNRYSYLLRELEALKK